MLSLLLWLGCSDPPKPPTTTPVDTDEPPVGTVDTAGTPTDSETPDTATLFACEGDTGPPPTDTAPVDEDGDGYTADVDCDDSAAQTHPGAAELCDGADNNCDGADDTLGYWPLDDGTGTIVADAGPLGLDGVLTGGSWLSDGAVGGALAFDGVGTWITLDHSELASMVGITLSVWVRPASLQGSSWDTIISRGATAGTDLACCRDSYFLGYYLQGVSFYTDTTLDNTPLLDGLDHSGHVGDWHHLAATWDPSTGVRAVYVDGVQTGTDDLGPPTAAYDGTPTRIGADTNDSTVVLPFHGAIDEVKIFGCAVTADEVAADHAAGWPW